MRKFLVGVQIAAVFTFSLAHGAGWWTTWDNYPQVPRITAKEVKALTLAGEPFVFVYAGYATTEIVCGSMVIPYTLVPPSADGSRVEFLVPQDYWVFCY